VHRFDHCPLSALPSSQRASGEDLKFEVVSGKEAKTTGLVPQNTADDA
jgi:hypothetical protein